MPRLTVSLGITSVVAYTYGCDDGKISQTRCAFIDGALGDRCRQCRGCRIPPAAGLARSAFVAMSKQASTAAPGGFHRPKTTPQSETAPCDDASPATYAPGMHPSPPHPSLV